jgi:CheY-like chemotaxis protein
MTPVVLIVDDSATNRYLLAFYVRQMGARVTEADSGAQALTLAAAQPPDLVLLDLHMPQMDGLETATRLHALPGLENVPIVAVTANVSPSTRSTVLRSGFAAYLAKPIDPDTFPAEVRRHLNLPPP